MLIKLLGNLFNGTARPPAPVGDADYATLVRCFDGGDLVQARSLSLAILRSNADDPAALYYAGLIALKQGDAAGALDFLSRALQASWSAQTALAVAKALQALSRHQEALIYYLQALDADADLFDAHLASAIILFNQWEIARAEHHFREGIRLQPQSLECDHGLTHVLDLQMRFADLVTHKQNLQRVLPRDGRKIMLALMTPQFYESAGDISVTRERLAGNISELLAGPPLRVENPFTEIGMSMFRLAYHGQNDRDILQQVTRLVRKAYQPRYMEARPRPRQATIRIGFVSLYFYSHSIGRLYKGLIESLSRRNFEVFVFSLSSYRDQMSEQIRVAADHYVDLANKSLADIESAIGGQGLDVLFYPDLGMSPLTYFLAYSRLAPLQCVSWGHPVTTGLDSIDCFISADAIESPGAEGHYSERLVRLPSFVLPAYERPPPLVDPMSRGHFGFSDDMHLYFCPQALFKIHPDFDQVIGRILQSDPIGEVVLIESEYPSFASLLRERFRRHFPEVVDRVRFIPRMSWPECLNLMAVSDVILDTFHFGGGNTSCEALAMGTPVVTLPPAFLRGRFTAACYWEMGLGEYVARDLQEYVDIALRLAQERDYRELAVGKIAAARDLLFDNMNSVREIEKFLLESVRET